MCRHLAYLGSPVTLRELLIDPPHGLFVQSWAPRRQRHGTVNADGFGVGWYVPGDEIPARYRQRGPIWADESFADIARVTRSGAVLAAVRSATPGTDYGLAAAAPMRAGCWLFSHNGALAGWAARDSAQRAALRSVAAALDPADLLELEARSDSALIWALVQSKLGSGAGLADALTTAICELTSAGLAGRLNLLLCDGTAIAATARGDTLCYRNDATGVTVASEPSDDEPNWTDVPDNSVLTATASAVTVQPLTLAHEGTNA